jgi:hypothetical protein
MRTFKSFRIKLPSGERYWTVVDDSYRPVQGVDDWLLYLRIGRDCAESTTESYAGAVALFFEWCALIGRDWHTTAGEFGRFVYWLQHYDLNSAPSAVARIVRGPRRVNVVLAAVREYFRHAAALGEVDDSHLEHMCRRHGRLGQPPLPEQRAQQSGIDLRDDRCDSTVRVGGASHKDRRVPAGQSRCRRNHVPP